LRFTGISTRRCEYAFPCDSTGLVDIDELTDRRRTDYFYARSMVGKEFSVPVVASIPVGVLTPKVVPSRSTLTTSLSSFHDARRDRHGHAAWTAQRRRVEPGARHPSTLRCRVRSRASQEIQPPEAYPVVAVYLPVPRLFGLLRSSYAQIGDLDRRAAASILARLEASGEIRAKVKSVYAPEEKDNPRVSLFSD
jgi:hypothetical protein